MTLSTARLRNALVELKTRFASINLVGFHCSGRVALKDWISIVARRFELSLSQRTRVTRSLRSAERLEARELLAVADLKTLLPSSGDGRSVISFSNLQHDLHLRENPESHKLQFADTSSSPLSSDWIDVNSVQSDWTLRTNQYSIFIAGIHGHDDGKVIFHNLSTYGHSLFLLSDNDVDNVSDGDWKIPDPPVRMTPDYDYHKAPDILKHAVEVVGVIDTRQTPGTASSEDAGDIGLYSHSTVKVGTGDKNNQGGLYGNDVTLATWWLGGSINVQGDKSKGITIDSGFIDGHSISVTAAVIAGGIAKPKGVELDINHTDVMLTDSQLTAREDIYVSASTEDLLGPMAGNKGAGWAEYGWWGGYKVLGYLLQNKAPQLSGFMNSASLAYRAAGSTVTVDDTSITAEKDISINSRATAETKIKAIQKNAGTNMDIFVAMAFAMSKATATTEIKNNAEIRSETGSVSIGSSAKSEAESEARTLAGDRKPNDSMTYNSNEKTKSFGVSLSLTNLESKTSTDASSSVYGGSSVSVTADGEVSNNPEAVTRSYKDGTAGVSVSLGFDTSTAESSVAGTIRSGGLPPVIEQAFVPKTASATISDPDNSEFLPLSQDKDAATFAAGDWIKAFVDPSSKLPAVGAVEGFHSLTPGDTYYVVDATDNQLQLAYQPGLDLEIPEDWSSGSPVAIPMSTQQSLTVQVTRSLDSALRSDNPAPSGPGYFYLPDSFLEQGQQVLFLREDAQSAWITKTDTPSTTPYANWAAGEPSNSGAGGVENNLVMLPDGTWNDVSKNELYGYVLYKPDNSYTWIPGPFTYANAVADADKQLGFIAFPQNADENAKIKAAAQGMATWLNSSDEELEGYWPVPDLKHLITAQSGTSSKPYANWAQKEPSNSGEQGVENNLVMLPDGSWNDVGGKEHHGYVLYKLDSTKLQYTYNLIPGDFTFEGAIADAADKGGYVAFPKDAATNQAIRKAADGSTVWLNASDENREGYWSFWDMTSLDPQIAGLNPGTTYYVIRHDDNTFCLADSASNADAGIAIPVPNSSLLSGNFLQWDHEVSFDPNRLNSTTDRLPIDLSKVPGIQTGDKVTYHVDAGVTDTLQLPEIIAVPTVSNLTLDPDQFTTLQRTVFDSANQLLIFPNHGLNSGDGLVYQTLNGSTPLNYIDYSSNSQGDPRAVAEGQTLYVISLDADRIRLALTAADAAAGRFLDFAAITDSGMYSLANLNGLNFTFDPLAFVQIPNVDTVQDTILFEDVSQLVTGQRVTYQAGTGNQAIGGLSSGKDYFLIIDESNAVRLADSWDNALLGSSLDLTGSGTSAGGHQTFTAWGIDPVHDWIARKSHGLQTGQAIRLQSGSNGPAGLADGQIWYVVRLSDDQFRLVTSLADSSTVGSQDPTAQPPRQCVDLLPYDPSAVVAWVSFENRTVVKSFNPGLSTPVVDLDKNTLAGSGWTTGDRVVYGAGGGQPIEGLQDEATYYIIALPNSRIALAKSYADAVSGNLIDLQSKGTIGVVPHSLRLEPDVQLLGDEQPLVYFDPGLVPPVDTTNDILRISQHGFTQGQQVTYLAGDGSPVGGLVHGGQYFVKFVDDDHFQLLKNSGDTQPIDLTTGATGSHHGFEVIRQAFAADSAIVGLSPEATYYAVVDRTGPDGLLRFANSPLEAAEASLLRFDLTTSATGYSNYFQPGSNMLGEAPGEGENSDNGIFVTSNLEATNGASAESGLGGHIALWEAVQSNAVLVEALKQTTNGLRNSVRELFGNPTTTSAARTHAGATFTASLAVAEAKHTVITTIHPGAVLQTSGDLVIDSAIAQSGQVSCIGGIEANEHTSAAVSVGLAVADYTNTALVNIGEQNAERVRLDAKNSMKLTTSIDYDKAYDLRSWATLDGLIPTGNDKSSESADESGGGFFNRLKKAREVLPAYLDNLGLANFLNVRVTNSISGEESEENADTTVGLSLAETFYRNTSEVTIWETDINQDEQFAGEDQSLLADATTSMTLISLAGNISFEPNLLELLKFKTFISGFLPLPGGNSKEGAGIGASQILVDTVNRTRARILGTSRITVSENSELEVNAQDIGRRTVLAQSGASASKGSGITGSVALLLGGDDTQGASLTVAQIDRGVSVTARSPEETAGKLSVTAHNHVQTWVQAGAVSTSAGGSSVGISFGLIDTPRTTLAYLGSIPDDDVDKKFQGPDFSHPVLKPGSLQVGSVTVDAQNTGRIWNLAIVGAV
ncbi:MAG: hypothetical protein RLZZ436_398, partial [Planctomycetota bacterium]